MNFKKVSRGDLSFEDLYCVVILDQFQKHCSMTSVSKVGGDGKVHRKKSETSYDIQKVWLAVGLSEIQTYFLGEFSSFEVEAWLVKFRMIVYNW